MKKALFFISLSVVFFACNRHQIREKKSDNGQLQEQYQVIETKDGSFAKDGYYKTWYSNGQIETQGEYAENKRTGNWKSWYSNGQLHEDINFKEDSLDGDFKKWHENGKKLIEGKYEFGKLIGKWQAWHDNGQLKNEQNYLNGKLEGKQTYWYSNGQKNTEGTYLNGLKDGLWIYYDQDGKIDSENQFKNGNDITLVGLKWLDIDKDTWEFFEDGSYILDITKKGERKKGTYKINGESLDLDGKDHKIKYISRDSIYASRVYSDWFYGSREVSRLKAKRIK
jgi:antitoxin component YwqK of YwqJK toxin-antitoxin module